MITSYVITTLPTSRVKTNLTIADPCKRTALAAIKLPLVVQPHLVVILDVDRAQKIPTLLRESVPLEGRKRYVVQQRLVTPDLTWLHSPERHPRFVSCICTPEF